MDLDFVEKLIGLVSRSPIAELEIERDGVRVRICRHAMASTPRTEVTQQVAAISAAPAPLSSSPARHMIRAPLTGVFYRAAAEGAPPLVSVGDIVEEGQKIGVLEAMKTFNVVESDRSGKVVDIPAGNAEAVQSGDVLFVLEESGQG